MTFLSVAVKRIKSTFTSNRRIKKETQYFLTNISFVLLSVCVSALYLLCGYYYFFLPAVSFTFWSWQKTVQHLNKSESLSLATSLQCHYASRSHDWRQTSSIFVIVLSQFLGLNHSAAPNFLRKTTCNIHRSDKFKHSCTYTALRRRESNNLTIYFQEREHNRGLIHHPPIPD